MKSRILVLLLSLTLLCSCANQETESVEEKDETADTTETIEDVVDTDSATHSIFGMVILSEDENTNAEMIAAVKKLRNSLQHKIHTLVFNVQSQQEEAVQDIINKHNVREFPAVIIDGKLLTEGESLEQAAEEAAKREMITIDQNLARDIIDEETLVVTFYICCYKEGEYIENGRVMVYLVERDEYEETYIGDTYRALIADSKEYYVESGSCHVPEMVYWQIPEGVDPEYLHIVMVVYDDEDKVLGTCCSAEDCSEKS